MRTKRLLRGERPADVLCELVVLWATRAKARAGGSFAPRATPPTADVLCDLVVLWVTREKRHTQEHLLLPKKLL